MSLTISRSAAASLVALLALSEVSFGGGQSIDPLPYPPAEGRVLWLRADRRVDLELGNTVSRWGAFDRGSLELTQTEGSQMPLCDPFGAGGRAALHFDGNDLLTSDVGMPTGDYTKIAVVKLDDYGANNNVLSGASEHALYYGNGDRVRMFHSGSFVISSVPTPLHEATILVAAFDATTGEGRLYQNGQLAGTGYAAPHADPGIQVGACAGNSFLKGSIPEVFVYDRVLPDAERQLIELVLDRRYRSASAPEVEYARTPRHGQVLQRDPLDRARIVIEGTVKTPGYDQIELRILRDGQPWSTESQPLSYNPTWATFTFDSEMVAGLYSYDVVITLLAGAQRDVVRELDSIVCGDTFLLNGQSNAVAHDLWGEGLANQSQSSWIRSFGSSIKGPGVVLDQHWGFADGEGSYAHCTVGAWALRAAERLLLEEQVPIGLINGAAGGSVIAAHQRNDVDPTDLSTIYGRLLYRAGQAEIDTEARALLWYQGESDGGDVNAYATGFGLLRDAWLQDYPALEKIYVFQVRPGCGQLNADVREFHRTLPDLYPDVEVMSTTAAPQYDGCHFHYVGFRELGDRISRVIARDIHGSTDTQEIDPPNIAAAELVGASNDSILLTFRDPDDVLIWEEGSEVSFTLNDAVSVISGAVAGNAILLQLSGPTSATSISYDGHPGDGPWILNARGVGALTFLEFPVAP